jgi:threonine/homoserine/homoserine lactone efflux protein
MTTLWVPFLAASTVLAVTPGPGVLYIVTRTLAQGRRAGLASVAGVALGNLGNAWGASLGLALLFAVSSLAFTVVKLAGGAYLIYLGVQALRAGSPAAPGPERPALRPTRLFVEGLWVALLNPKTAMFFAAFLPQFMDPGRSTLVQSLQLGAVFVAVAAATDSAYVLLASAASPLATRWQWGARLGRRASAGVFVGLGLYAMVSDVRR